MKTEIVLCDKCKDRVGKEVCCICEKDVCENCSEKVPINFAWNEQEFLKLIICRTCKSEIITMLKNKEHDIEKFKKLIVSYMKNNLVLEELERGDKKNA